MRMLSRPSPPLTLPTLPAAALALLIVRAVAACAPAAPDWGPSRPPDPSELTLVDEIFFPLPPPLAVPITPLPGFWDRVWDFEDGTLQGWTPAGDAFARQPTAGDNVSTLRAIDIAGYRRRDRDDEDIFRVLARQGNMLRDLGGNYWDVPYPTGVQGRFWVGTFEDRPRFSVPWGSTRGERPTGTLTSPTFVVGHTTLELRVGGGCDPALLGVRMEVLVLTGLDSSGRARFGWRQAQDEFGRDVVATGRCSEVMRTVRFSIRRLAGMRARLVAADRSSGPWGHLSFDEVRLTNWPRPERSWKESAPVWGFADTHAHLANHLSSRSFNAEGRPEVRTLWGDPGGSFLDYVLGADQSRRLMERDLSRCNAVHYVGPSAIEGYTAARDFTLNRLEGAGLGRNFHDEDGGYPYFRQWPLWYSAVHQQMHVTWIHRAYAGGLRLLVADVGNSEALGFAMTAGGGQRFTSDFGAIESQISFIREFVARNSAWMELALTPRDARRIINEGKLAVVLGLEVDFPLDGCASTPVTRTMEKCECRSGENCDTVNGWAKRYGDWGLDLSNQDVLHVAQREAHRSCGARREARLNALYQAGVRHVIPVHVVDNEFGGTAIYNGLFNAAQVFSSGVCRPYLPREGDASISTKLGSFSIPIFENTFLVHTPSIWEVGLPRPVAAMRSHVNQVGLTAEGFAFYGEMMRRGMIIDLEHSSQATKDQVLFAASAGIPEPDRSPIIRRECPDLRNPDCLAMAYPVMSSHGGPRSRQATERGSENSLTSAQLLRIRDIGGLIGIGANPGNLGSYPSPGNRVPSDCGGSSKPFAQSYLKVADLWGLIDDRMAGVAIGTDLNGFDFHANPRFGSDACHASRSHSVITRLREVALQPERVRYQPYDRGKNPRADGGIVETFALPLTTPVPALPPEVELTVSAEDESSRYYTAFLRHRSEEASDPPLRPLVIEREGEVTRVFDINYDGLAHYGMLPDFLQDLRVVGVTPEQMGPVFRSAEQFITMWEKACRLSDRRVSAPGCGR